MCARGLVASICATATATANAASTTIGWVMAQQLIATPSVLKNNHIIISKIPLAQHFRHQYFDKQCEQCVWQKWQKALVLAFTVARRHVVNVGNENIIDSFD